MDSRAGEGAKAYAWLMAYRPHPRPLSTGEGSRVGVANHGAATRHPLLPPHWGSLADDILLVRFRPASGSPQPAKKTFR